MTSRDMAHPVDWARPRRWERLQFAIAVFVMGFFIFASMFAILAFGLVAGAVLGIDMTIQ